MVSPVSSRVNSPVRIIKLVMFLVINRYDSSSTYLKLKSSSSAFLSTIGTTRTITLLYNNTTSIQDDNENHHEEADRQHVSTTGIAVVPAAVEE
jgi:hypothetical protein